MAQINMALDIGTANIRAATSDDGLFLSESAAVALKNGEGISFGNAAYALMERTPPGVHIGFPMRNARLADEALLRAWLKRLLKEMRGRAHLLLSCSPDMATAEKRVLGAIAMDCGAQSCCFADADVVSAIGANLFNLLPESFFLCDVGAGHVSATLFGGNGALHRECMPYGASEAMKALLRAIRESHRFAVGVREAEALLRDLSGLRSIAASVRGVDLESGFPREREIEAEHVAQAIEPVVSSAVSLCESVLSRCSPVCMEELADNGITIVGGGAQTYGMESRITKRANLPTRICPEPEAASGKGLIELLKHPNAYDPYITPFEDILTKR